MSLLDYHFYEQLRLAVRHDYFWNNYLNEYAPKVGLHLAVFVEPYLQLVLLGQKTVESRFSKSRIAPYNSAKEGDIVLLKKSSGPVLGICQITNVCFYELDPNSWHTIRKEYTESLCAQDPGFWRQRRAASYATIMQLHNVHSFSPIKLQKRDRRGWVLLKLHFEEI